MLDSISAAFAKTEDRPGALSIAPCEALSAMGSTAADAAPVPLRRLKDRRSTVRAAVVDALGAIVADDDRVLEALAERLDDEPPVRDAAARARSVRTARGRRSAGTRDRGEPAPRAGGRARVHHRWARFGHRRAPRRPAPAGRRRAPAPRGGRNWPSRPPRRGCRRARRVGRVDPGVSRPSPGRRGRRRSLRAPQFRRRAPGVHSHR